AARYMCADASGAKRNPRSYCGGSDASECAGLAGAAPAVRESAGGGASPRRFGARPLSAGRGETCLGLGAEGRGARGREDDFGGPRAESGANSGPQQPGVWCDRSALDTIWRDMSEISKAMKE
ncbi:unnamed protein product, partial [Symbiodinium necroappetens]